MCVPRGGSNVSGLSNTAMWSHAGCLRSCPWPRRICKENRFYMLFLALFLLGRRSFISSSVYMHLLTSWQPGFSPNKDGMALPYRAIKRGFSLSAARGSLPSDCAHRSAGGGKGKDRAVPIPRFSSRSGPPAHQPAATATIGLRCTTQPRRGHCVSHPQESRLAAILACWLVVSSAAVLRCLFGLREGLTVARPKPAFLLSSFISLHCPCFFGLRVASERLPLENEAASGAGARESAPSLRRSPRRPERTHNGSNSK